MLLADFLKPSSHISLPEPTMPPGGESAMEVSSLNCTTNRRLREPGDPTHLLDFPGRCLVRRWKEGLLRARLWREFLLLGELPQSQVALLPELHDEVADPLFRNLLNSFRQVEIKVRNGGHKIALHHPNQNGVLCGRGSGERARFSLLDRVCGLLHFH
jgi:hypothetical protein